MYTIILVLTLHLPCIAFDKVYHPGSIWLGRLDEVDANLVPAEQQWQERGGDYFIPGVWLSEVDF